MRVSPAFFAALFLFGFGTGYTAETKPVKATETKPIKINIINARQQEVGEATLMDTPNGVLIRVTLRQNPQGISPGTHAIHIQGTDDYRTDPAGDSGDRVACASSSRVGHKAEPSRWRTQITYFTLEEAPEAIQREDNCGR